MNPHHSLCGAPSVRYSGYKLILKSQSERSTQFRPTVPVSAASFPPSCCFCRSLTHVNHSCFISLQAEPIRVLVTGAAGQIAYSLLYSIAKGDVFGKDQVRPSLS